MCIFGKPVLIVVVFLLMQLQCAGNAAVVQYVLPHVEAFIVRMSAAKVQAETAASGNTRLQSKIRHVYITIIQTLFQTLASVVGLDVMQLHVPSGKLFAEHLRLKSSPPADGVNSASVSPRSDVSRSRAASSEMVTESGFSPSQAGFARASPSSSERWRFDADQSFSAHEESVTAMAVCAREQVLCTGSRDSTVRCWRLRNNYCPVVERTYNGHRRPIVSLHTLAAGGGSASKVASCDGTIDVWDIKTGKRLIHYSADVNAVSTPARVAASDDAHSVAQTPLFTATLAMSGDVSLACAVDRRVVTYDLRCPLRRHGIEWCISKSTKSYGRIHSLTAVGNYIIAAGVAGAAMLDARMGIVVQTWNLPQHDLCRLVSLDDASVVAVKTNGKGYVWNITDSHCDSIYRDELFSDSSSSPMRDVARSASVVGWRSRPQTVHNILFHQIRRKPDNLSTQTE